jgi:hypothetical protein
LFALLFLRFSYRQLHVINRIYVHSRDSRKQTRITNAVGATLVFRNVYLQLHIVIPIWTSLCQSRPQSLLCEIALEEISCTACFAKYIFLCVLVLWIYFKLCCKMTFYLAFSPNRFRGIANLTSKTLDNHNLEFC